MKRFIGSPVKCLWRIKPFLLEGFLEVDELIVFQKLILDESLRIPLNENHNLLGYDRRLRIEVAGSLDKKCN